MYDSASLQLLSELDRRIVAVSKDIKILSRLSWPIEVQREFLAGWREGNPRLPQPVYQGDSLADEIDELTRILRDIPADGPLSDYLRDTARSYRVAACLIEAAGTPQMLEHTRALYGVAGDSLSGGQLDNTHAAEHFLDVSGSYRRQNVNDEPEYCLSAEAMKAEMEDRLSAVFEPGRVAVTIDPHMASKAAAGATRVRLRSGTCFSEYDLEQLLQHEAFVHSLTALNGRNQPHFQSFGLGSPRTTGAQEGLATFSELVTGAIDISRMERIALRVLAVDKAIRGADFIEVFKFFLDTGQPEMESFNSAMRVFRGAPLTGGYAFTKDVVYLHGLMEVHTFFRWALRHEKLSLTRLFFAGRMTIDDVVALEPFFLDGTLVGPRYLPPWMTRINGLAGYLAFSVFANRIRIDALHEGHRFDAEQELDDVT